MNASVVYFSNFGNTKLIADTIAKELQKVGQVRLIPMQEFTPASIEGTDLVVMGVPTHVMNLPKAVRPILEGLPKRMLTGVKVAAYDTSYAMSWFLNLFTASKRLLPKLRQLGGQKVANPEIFVVSGREGPLVEGELERAKDWARLILKQAGFSQLAPLPAAPRSGELA